MLRKLFKYDFKGMGRLIVPISLLAIAVALVGCAAMFGTKNISGAGLGSMTEFALSAILSIIVFTSVVAVIAYSVLCFVVIFARFYKNFFSDEGYLTFTLPVTTRQLLLSKLFASVLWLIAAVIITFLLAVLMISAGTAPEGAFMNVNIFKDIFNVLSASTGDAGVGIMIMTAVCAVVQWTCMICMIFLAITIGSTVARKGKVIASVGFYFAINSAVEMLFVIIIVVIGIIAENFDSAISLAWLDNITPEGFMYGLLGGIAVLYAAVAVIQLVITNSILKKRLNLS
ncbi:MAG: hypothetical protein ACI4SJ_07005 [Candidatus Avispirillum sp.]